MERLSVLCDREMVGLSDILYYGQETERKATWGDFNAGLMPLADVEKQHIIRVLKHFDFRIGKTASFLGIDRKTLRMKIKNYHINMEE
jgi:DNA-binding NtrC family response regulator